jgi:hypothetical protein
LLLYFHFLVSLVLDLRGPLSLFVLIDVPFWRLHGEVMAIVEMVSFLLDLCGSSILYLLFMFYFLYYGC